MKILDFPTKVKLRNLFFKENSNCKTVGSKKAIELMDEAMMFGVTCFPPSRNIFSKCNESALIAEKALEILGIKSILTGDFLRIVERTPIDEINCNYMVNTMLKPVKLVSKTYGRNLLSKDGVTIAAYEKDFVVLSNGRYYKNDSDEWGGLRTTSIQLTNDEYLKLKKIGSGKVVAGIRNLINKHC